MRVVRRPSLFVGALLCVLALLVAGCGGSSGGSSSGGTSVGSGESGSGSDGGGEATPVLVGGLCNLSGSLSAFGSACKSGLEIGQEAINAEGPFMVGGKPYEFELKVVDGHSEPSAAVASTRELIQDDGVHFMFGPDTSLTDLQVAGVVKSADVLQFAEGTAIQELLGQSGYERQFGTVLSGVQVMAGGPQVLEALGVKPGSGTVAMVFPDEPAGEVNTRELGEALEEAGYEAKTFLFPPTTTEFAPLATKLKAEGVTAIVAGYAANWIFPLARSVAQLNAAKAVVGFGGLPAEVPLAYEEETGKPYPLPYATLTTQQNLGDPTTPGAETLKKLYVEKTGEDPSSLYASGLWWYYEPWFVLAEAMEKAGTVEDVDAIAEAIGEITRSGVSKNYHFGTEHIAVYGTDYAVVNNGKVTWHYVPPPEEK
jgi:branched-chain amino acid transport system substrate-binding protein